MIQTSRASPRKVTSSTASSATPGPSRRYSMPRPRSSANMAMPKPPSPASLRRLASRRARSTTTLKTARNRLTSCRRRSAWTWCDSSANAPVPRGCGAPEIERFGAFFDLIREVRRNSCASSMKLNSRRSATRACLDTFLPPMCASSAARVLPVAIDDFSDEELRPSAIFCWRLRLSSRRYSYSDGTATTVPEHVISAYRKLITRGLFNVPGCRGIDNGR